MADNKLDPKTVKELETAKKELTELKVKADKLRKETAEKLAKLKK